MKPFFERKIITPKQQIGISLVLLVLAAFLSYLVSYSANFMWEFQKANPKFLLLSGSVALLGFFIFGGIILWIANKYLPKNTKK